jgi:hypothetical protein
MNGVEDSVSESRPGVAQEPVKIPQRVTAKPKFDEAPIPAAVPAAV